MISLQKPSSIWWERTMRSWWNLPRSMMDGIVFYSGKSCENIKTLVLVLRIYGFHMLLCFMRFQHWFNCYLKWDHGIGFGIHIASQIRKNIHLPHDMNLHYLHICIHMYIYIYTLCMYLSIILPFFKTNITVGNHNFHWNN